MRAQKPANPSDAEVTAISCEISSGARACYPTQRCAGSFVEHGWGRHRRERATPLLGSAATLFVFGVVVRVGEVGMRIVRMRREFGFGIVRLMLITLAAVASGAPSLV